MKKAKIAVIVGCGTLFSGEVGGGLVFRGGIWKRR